MGGYGLFGNHAVKGVHTDDFQPGAAVVAVGGVGEEAADESALKDGVIGRGEEAYNVAALQSEEVKTAVAETGGEPVSSGVEGEQDAVGARNEVIGRHALALAVKRHGLENVPGVGVVNNGLRVVLVDGGDNGGVGGERDASRGASGSPENAVFRQTVGRQPVRARVEHGIRVAEGEAEPGQRRRVRRERVDLASGVGVEQEKLVVGEGDCKAPVGGQPRVYGRGGECQGVMRLVARREVVDAQRVGECALRGGTFGRVERGAFREGFQREAHGVGHPAVPQCLRGVGRERVGVPGAFHLVEAKIGQDAADKQKRNGSKRGGEYAAAVAAGAAVSPLISAYLEEIQPVFLPSVTLYHSTPRSSFSVSPRYSRLLPSLTLVSCSPFRLGFERIQTVPVVLTSASAAPPSSASASAKVAPLKTRFFILYVPPD